MPIKFDKDVSTHLFKYIRQIDLKFNPFDARTRSVRELYRQVHATRFKTANPKLQILTEVHNRADEPLAIFKFADGTESVFQSQHNIANEIIFQVHLKAQELDAQYEMSGKNIDDELSPWRDNS